MFSAPVEPPLPPPPVAEYALAVYEEEEPLNIKDLGRQIADEYGVSFEVIDAVVACESHWNPEAYNDSENSLGLVQIHHDSWPEITDEERKDPEYALRFLARHLKEGNGDLWTCYRSLGK